MGRLGENRYKVSGLDLMVLTLHAHRHADKHGHLDADRSLDQLTRDLSFYKILSESVLESGLYCANMLNEEGDFWHPYDMNFDAFVNRMLMPYGKDLDRTYNFIKERK